ncbi:MAG TPA: polysaccharide deacetylase family protein [Draconibacterium sp.]|nr:polysaccharide deacetylase family protein [Draconibacterium sp.]HRX12449.1 polysaccharide deacetylase family protein [Draconibacterium sp.]
MLKFRSLNIVIAFVIVALVILQLFGFEYAWIFLIVLILIYSVVVTLGVVKVKWQFFMPVICKVPNKQKVVFLSFDDGPGEKTRAILDLLKDYKATGNFFCVGKRLEENPELAKLLVDEGHFIGNHTYSHSNKFPLQSKKEMVAEIENTNSLIKKITGTANRYFRPPYGVSNPNIATAIRKLNMICIGWSIRSFDTMDNVGNKALNKITSNLKSGDIILLHDTSPQIIFILEQLLIFLLENGFTTQRIDKYLEDKINLDANLLENNE